MDGDSDNSDDQMPTDIGHLSKGLLNSRIFCYNEEDSPFSQNWTLGHLDTKFTQGRLSWEDELKEKYSHLKYHAHCTYLREQKHISEENNMQL